LEKKREKELTKEEKNVLLKGVLKRGGGGKKKGGGKGKARSPSSGKKSRLIPCSNE